MNGPSPTRGPYEGVTNVVRFNWPFYVVSFALIGAAVIFLAWIPTTRWWWLAIPVATGALGATWFLLSSLVVSYWIYDRSPLYRWAWLPRAQSRCVVNVHSGFDESSAALRSAYPDSELVVLDFYDAERSPEPSIARARRTRPPLIPARTIRPETWLMADGSADLVTMITAVHELRRRPDREAFFREVRRVLAPDGRALLVEHLRDGANFLAFGPGFLHFLPRSEWLHAFATGGLCVEREFSVTPFIRIFVLAAC